MVNETCQNHFLRCHIPRNKLFKDNITRKKNSSRELNNSLMFGSGNMGNQGASWTIEKSPLCITVGNNTMLRVLIPSDFWWREVGVNEPVQ